VRRTVAALVLTPVLLAGGLLTAVVVGSQPDPTSTGGCTPVGGPISVSGVPSDPIAGFAGEQLANAAVIAQVGGALGVSARGQAIGIMTAMGESSLVVLDHGDAVGPDSRGLFQQRDNGQWGSYADRMDPATSATSFFRALLQVPGWDTLPPTLAAHQTQHNADPYYYTRYWDAAVAVLEALAGATVTGIAPGTGTFVCTGSTPFTVRADGWTAPASGPLTSLFGSREDPTGGGTQFHAGIDLAPGCDAPILAAAAGTVVRAGAASGFGNLIVIDHGAGVVTRYGHMEDDGLLVVVGQPVAAGQQIARIGSNGDSTACHLHFEVLVNGTAVDPVPFLAQEGSPLR
jgi:murein DD-endopeptidase MepM/ murein hydrolase activator NlpD